MHARSRLRAATRAALISGVPGVSGRVENVRTYPYNRAELPAVEISTPAESVVVMTDDGDLDREITLLIIIFDVAGDDLEDRMDALAEQVERVVFEVVQQNDFAHSVLSMREELDPTESMEKRGAMMALEFAIRCFTEIGALQQL